MLVKLTTSLIFGKIFMDKTSVLVDGVRILGTTLWSLIPPENAKSIQKCINDYNLIYIEDGDGKKHKLTVDESVRWFNDERKWLEDQINEAKVKGEKVLVLTHHAPSLVGTSDPKFFMSENNPAFASNLEYMMGPPVAAWCFGHTHYSSDQIFKGTRVVSNQVGYIAMGEKSGFNAGMVINI